MREYFTTIEKCVKSFTQNKLPLFPSANHPKVFQYHPQYEVVQLPSRIYCQYHPLTHLSTPCYQATCGSGVILQPHLPSHIYSHIKVWKILQLMVFSFSKVHPISCILNILYEEAKVQCSWLDEYQNTNLCWQKPTKINQKISLNGQDK